ncbi:lipase 3-like [Plodia interpunctella]|uniref:lipase 3-like n=1 Tax=Plodia interpunctella TaxID=58824 RepID=UPI002368E6D6|nr:lipase 3-like [Plodia interpunctella]
MTLFVVLSFLFLTTTKISQVVCQDKENSIDISLNVSQIIRESGFTEETHDVVTDDGYKLRMYRIVGSGEPVFVMHGLLCSSDDWITPQKERALALVLAAEGYDVWLGNARGNVHSRRHTTLSPEGKEFWDFSWDEIGRYDLPAMIDYVLDATNRAQLSYIGHSQGTTSFFVMGSERPEYNDKIKKMIALSIVAWSSRVTSPPVRLYAPISQLTEPFGITEVFARHQLLTTTLTNFGCNTPTSATLVCNNLIFLIGGFDSGQINSTYLPLIYQHFPAGAAYKQILHYMQLVNSGHFRPYDYGLIANLGKYFAAKPPDYSVDKVTAPVYVFHGENDWLSTLADVKIMINKISNFKELYTVPWKTFNHMDYLYANDAKTLVHDKILSILRSD